MREMPSAADVLSRLAGMLGLRDTEARLSSLIDSLQRQTRAQLLEWSRCLELTGVGDLSTEALLRRVREALEALGVGAPAAGAPAREAREAPAADTPPAADRAHRFDLGLPAEGTVAPEHIPWSYGQDRVTAMAVDPDRLFVYWEVTDEAMARARQGLGQGGPDAWLDLRVYDVTGRLFDGTNAHAYADHKVGRHDRQWFLDVGRPTSAAIVEIGLKSFEGYFVRIARSGRVEFPRKEPVSPGRVEWLTVRAATGELPPPEASGSSGEEAPWAASPAGAAELSTHGPLLAEELVPGEAFETPHAWERTFRTAWADEGRTLEWQGPVVRTTWEAGPFEAPIESPALVEERHEGTVQRIEQNGRTRIVYGPWQVVIRGLGARAERQVIATWEVQRSWVTSGDVGSAPLSLGPVGASEHRLGASEARVGGASEVWRLGATELRFLGASERLLGGASERLYGGASERRASGASERRLGGASERTYGGSSEPRLAGPDDQPLPYPTRKG